MLWGRSEVTDDLAQRWRQAEAGIGSAICLVGEPGIGKTAIVEWARSEWGSQCLVLSCTGVEIEQQLPFANLSDLLDAHVHLAASLPVPQRLAIESALALAPGGQGPSLAVATAALGMIRRLTAAGPVLVLVDDVQWLDPPTAEVLAFVARRIGSDRVLMVAASRTGMVPAWMQAVAAIELAPLADQPAAQLLASVAPDLPAPVSQAVLHAAAGIPLALVELPAVLSPDERSGSGQVPRLIRPGGRIGDLYRRRVADLPGPTRRALLLAALTAHEELELLTAAWHALGVGARELAAAERGGLYRIFDGRAWFVHPLARSAVIYSATAYDVQQTHEALASVLGASERGWHLAAARPGPSQEVAAALDAVAAHARDRHAHLRACDAFVEAAGRTVEPVERVRRLVDAGEAAQRGGDLRRAVAVVEGCQRDLAEVPGPLRRRAQLLGASACAQAGLADRSGELARSILDDPDSSAPERVMAWGITGYASFVGGRAAAMLEAADHLGELLQDDMSLAVAAQAMFVMARSAAVLEQPQRRERAISWLEARLPDLLTESSLVLTHTTFLLAQYGRAAAMAQRIPELVAEAEQAGELRAVPFMLVAEATAAIELGDWDRAERCLDRARAVSLETGQLYVLGGALYLRAQVAATRGEVAMATALLDTIDKAVGSVMVDTLARALTAYAAGDLDASADYFVTYWRNVANNVVTNWAPGRVVFGSDAVAVLVAVGRRVEAEEVAAEIHRRAHLSGEPLMMAESHRVDGLLGTVEPGEAFAAALASLGDWEHPFARARIQLNLGEHLRRRSQLTAARPLLVQARDQFEMLRAQPWLERATAEHRASGGRRRASGADGPLLTDRQRDVARAVAQGRTNQEIATALFMSVKTVESHVTKVLAALGIRNRTQLAARVQGDPDLLG